MIRWITPTLGTAPASSGEIDSTIVVLDVRDLVDKFGNSPLAVRSKIEQGVALLGQGKRIVVCCDYGISRSNAIAAGVLAISSAIPFDQAIKEVSLATGENEIKLEPLNAVRAAIATNDPTSLSSDTSRILITGGSGFIGQALQRALGDSFYVVAPGRDTVDLLSGALALDLLVKQHGINRIVHLANPRIYTSNRAIGEMLTFLKNVLDVCRENHIGLIYLSNWEVYSGYQEQETVADENFTLLPKGPYGEAKLLCETLLNHHRKMYSLKCAVIRSSSVYGEASDRPKFISNFIKKARENVTIQTHRYRNGPPRLDLLYIDDLIAALVAIIRREYWGTLNLGSGFLQGTHDVAKLIVDKVGSRSLVEFQDVDDYTANVRMEITKAKEVLSWQPAMPFVRGLDRVLANYLGD